MLEALKAIKEYENFAICRERHQDGQYHLHCMLRYAAPINIRNASYYDVNGYHPNIQSARKPKDVLTYIKKDGNFLENWPTKRSYAEIIEAAKSKEEFLNLVKENQPKDFIINNERIEYYADKYFTRPDSPHYELFSPQPWTLPNEITNWLSGEFPKKGILN